MGRSFSIYLDGIRFLASIVVLLHHFALPSLTGGNYELIRARHLGDHAVIVFFVLSGYVVAYAADQKERTPLTYFFNRATRMYSVALPVVCVTLALDAIGARVNPESYQEWGDPTVPELDELWRALTFTNQLGFGNHRIGTNGPYWSLGYEVWYYVLFGLAVFWHGRIKYVLLAITSLLIGPKILLLMPAWCFGALAYHRVSRGPELERWKAIFYAAVPLLACILLAVAQVPHKLQTATFAVLGAEFVSRDMYYSSAFAWDAVLGGLVAIHFAGMARLRLPELPRGLRRRVRWLAGATFSIYIFHYPTLVFVNAVLPRELAPILRHSALLGITVVLCFVFAQLFERQLERTRSLLVYAWTCGKRRLERPGRVVPAPKLGDAVVRLGGPEQGLGAGVSGIPTARDGRLERVVVGSGGRGCHGERAGARVASTGGARPRRDDGDGRQSTPARAARREDRAPVERSREGIGS